MKKILILLFVFLGMYLLSGYAIGFYVEKKLEKTLTDLFGMKVTIERLYARPWPGYASAKRMTFHNQEHFDDRHHFDIRGIRFNINYLALLNKHVDIDNAVFEQPVFFIDLREPVNKDGPRTNITTWVHHIKERNKEKENGEDGPGWKVEIHSLVLQEGAFIFQDSTLPDNVNRLYFHIEHGRVENFHWPTENPAELDQPVEIRGRFGEVNPTPYRIEGMASFGTADVSFNLKGESRGIDVADLTMLWEGLPVGMNEGQMDLKIHATSVLRDFKADNQITLRNLKFKPGSKPVDIIWGIPLVAWAGFLQNNRVIELRMPVHGNIADPEFYYHRAFRRAFQDALKYKTQTGILMLKSSASKLTELPQAVASSIEKVANNKSEKSTDKIEAKNETSSAT